ncbi:sulfatase-like hydrolase/transferase, partial [Algibacter sp.]|nr:sulfatase-like hydrolase/transferase [Algibacter sp.]
MKKINLLLVLGILFLNACKSENKEEREASKPNVLFIAVDDLNTWISPIDNFSNAKTPNFDRLASMGVTFTNAHVQAPLCGPSRASI